MVKPAREHPPKGASSAQEIYTAVGIALSWWEGSEDALMGLFDKICVPSNSIAYEVYVSSPRSRRNFILKMAIEKSRDLQDNEKIKLNNILRNLDNLSATRNEIAHGYCVNYTSRVGDEVVMQGHYLMSSFYEGRFRVRGPRYAHTAVSIDNFTKEVKSLKKVVDDIYLALLTRIQEHRSKMSPSAQLLEPLINAVSAGKISPDEFISNPFVLKTLSDPNL